jgi:pimeloyl-ACP methyl ester carboxylesterase
VSPAQPVVAGPGLAIVCADAAPSARHLIHEPAGDQLSDIVFVPGSYHGGWYFDAVAADLRALGHRVLTPTLSGLPGARAHEGTINLDTHIDDVLAVLEAEQVRDAVLIGHSYGGLVVTGIVARGGASVSQLIYLDAMLPPSGQRFWDVIPEALREAILGASADGVMTAPPADLKSIDERVAPHPIATYLQPVHYDAAVFPARKTYVWAEGNPGSPFKAMHDRVAALPGWEVVAVPHGHDLMREAPAQMTELISALLEP